MGMGRLGPLKIKYAHLTKIEAGLSKLISKWMYRSLLVVLFFFSFAAVELFLFPAVWWCIGKSSSCAGRPGGKDVCGAEPSGEHGWGSTPGQQHGENTGYCSGTARDCGTGASPQGCSANLIVTSGGAVTMMCRSSVAFSAKVTNAGLLEWLERLLRCAVQIKYVL